MARNLTPEKMTYESFRHSQGYVGLQFRIFRYMNLQFGLQPVLNPTAADLERYKKYLTGAHKAGSTTHLRTNPNVRLVGNEVAKMFAKLRVESRMPYVARINETGLTEIVPDITEGIASQELCILGLKNPWVSASTEQPEDRPQRSAARVKNGRPSFLYHHGRDGHTTGYAEFDQMYTDVWKIAGTENWEYGSRLADSVAAAELTHIGKLSLAQ